MRNIGYTKTIKLTEDDPDQKYEFTIENIRYGGLEINSKTDRYDKNIKLSGVGFKLYKYTNNGWEHQYTLPDTDSDGYTSSSSSIEGRNKSANLNLKNEYGENVDTLYTIKPGSYYLFEYKNPNPGYNVKYQGKRYYEEVHAALIGEVTIEEGKIAKVQNLKYEIIDPNTGEKKNIGYATNEQFANVYIYKYVEKEVADGELIKVALKGAGFKLRRNNEYIKLRDAKDSSKNVAEFFSDENGKVSIERIPVNATYTIYETTFPEGVDPKIQPGYDSTLKAVKIATIKIDKDGTIYDTTYTQKVGNHTKDGKKDGVWLETDSAKIKNQSGIETYYRTKKVVNKTGTKEAEVYLYIANRKYINITGYVWDDINPPDKQNQTADGKYTDNPDIRAKNENITVRLYHYKLNDDGTRSETATLSKKITTLDDNGEYKLKNVLASDLKYYYVEFDYSNYSKFAKSVNDYKENNNYIYVPVVPNFEEENTSKAILENVAPTEDADIYSNIENRRVNTGKNSNTNFFCTMSETNFKNWTYVEGKDKIPTLHNVNLGLRQIIKPEDSIYTTLENIHLSINGYNYDYNVSPEDVLNIDNAVYKSAGGFTAIRQGFNSYSAEMYPADIAYNSTDSSKNLKVIATYRINIKNEMKSEILGEYKEDELKVKQLKVKYDSYMYEKPESEWSGDEGNIQYEKDLQANDSGDYEVYVNFEVKKDALKDLISQTRIISSIPVTATATLSHTYYRYDYCWNEPGANTWQEKQKNKPNSYYNQNSTWKYYQINKNGGKIHSSIPIEKSAEAYYFTLKLGGSRTISGTVFKDEKDRDLYNSTHEVLGDGKYDKTKENVIESVKVELLDANTNNTAKLYRAAWKKKDDGTLEIIETQKENGILCFKEDKNFQDGDEDGIYIKERAETVTDKNGRYYFKGIVPGEYYVRFTYGDGTQSIYDKNGNQIKDSKGNVVKISSGKYKSTIVQDVKIKYAYENKNVNGTGNISDNTKYNWYLYDTEDDNKAVNNEASFVNKQSIYLDGDINNKSSKTANTPKISVPIEFNKTDKSEKLSEKYSKYEKINFGIIEKPEIRIEVRKEISNINIKLQTGQNLVAGNPTQNIHYVANLDTKWSASGSRNTKVELDNEYLYGATAEIEYLITITNKSELTYKTENYYKYGIASPGEEATVTIENILELLDPDLSFISSDIEANTKNRSELLDSVALDKAYKNSINDNSITEIQTINAANKGELYTENGNTSNPSKIQFKVNSEGNLSLENDMDFESYTKVITVQAVQDLYSSATGDIGTDELENSAKVNVTPSTGLDRSMKYIIAITIVLIGLGGVIVCIKKIIK